MGFDVKAWLSSKVFGSSGPQAGVSGYAKPKSATMRELDAADIEYPRRGDTDGEYDTYGEDRNFEEEE